MQIFEIDISELKPYEKNARIHPEEQVNLLAKNIERFGFTTPILVSDDNEVIAGHGRLLALKKLNRTKAFAVRMTGLTPDEIKALRLADNQIASLGGWNMEAVIEELKALEAGLFDFTGFDKEVFDGHVLADEINELARERDIDLGKYQVLTVEAPEAPRLKARMSFYFDNIEEFNKVKEFFKLHGGELDTKKLMNLL